MAVANVRAKKGEPLQFFQAKIANSPDGCWLWPFAKDNYGYGVFFIEGKRWKVHRYSLYLSTGRNPDGEQACHGSCHNPCCFNPQHLYWGSPKDNAKDRARDGTENYGAKQSGSKLKESDVLSIRADARPIRIICSDYNVSYQTISDVKRRRSWAWLES